MISNSVKRCAAVLSHLEGERVPRGFRETENYYSPGKGVLEKEVPRRVECSILSGACFPLPWARRYQRGTILRIFQWNGENQDPPGRRFFFPLVSST